MVTSPQIFDVSCIGLFIITVIWLALLIIMMRQKSLPMLLGPAGTLMAAIPILGAWFPDALQPLWTVVQLTCLFWLMSFVLIGVAMIFAFIQQVPKSVRLASMICGSMGLLLNAFALLAFMWDATVSPGGV